LGIIAREYEVSQLVQLLQTMKQDSPAYSILMQSIIENMNLNNREQLMAAMQQAAQPNPQAQQMAMQAQQVQLALQQSQTAALNAQAAESQARAGKLAVEAQLAPEELEIDKIEAVTKNLKEGNEEDREFERRLKVANTLLKEKELQVKNQPKLAPPDNSAEKELEQKLLNQLMG
jgi:transcriptional antiterminator Rof (Rho-off)